MSEFEQIMAEWHRELNKARQSGRGEPVICLMDPNLYPSFLGCLQAWTERVRPNKLPPRARVGPCTFDGIDVWPGCAGSYGMVFGYRDECLIL